MLFRFYSSEERSHPKPNKMKYLKYPAVSLSLLAMLGFFCCPVSAADETEPEEGSKVEKNRKIQWDFTPDPALPDVLLLGDSISIGYTLQVRELLKDKANVFRPSKGNRPVNCSGTTRGLRFLDAWLEGREWSVIHFNWGLHDLKHVKTAGGDAKSNDPESPTQATLEVYTKNMEAIVEKLEATGARLVFATTTPVVEGTLNPLRVPEDPVRYNEAALALMKEHSIPVNDLYSFCLPNLKEWQLPKNVHFRGVGSAALAKKVATVIEDELEAEEKSSVGDEQAQ